jgi:hypothetical protein
MSEVFDRIKQQSYDKNGDRYGVVLSLNAKEKKIEIEEKFLTTSSKFREAAKNPVVSETQRMFNDQHSVRTIFHAGSGVLYVLSNGDGVLSIRSPDTSMPRAFAMNVGAAVTDIERKNGKASKHTLLKNNLFAEAAEVGMLKMNPKLEFIIPNIVNGGEESTVYRTEISTGAKVFASSILGNPSIPIAVSSEAYIGEFINGYDVIEDGVTFHGIMPAPELMSASIDLIAPLVVDVDKDVKFYDTELRGNTPVDRTLVRINGSGKTIAYKSGKEIYAGDISGFLEKMEIEKLLREGKAKLVTGQVEAFLRGPYEEIAYPNGKVMLKWKTALRKAIVNALKDSLNMKDKTIEQYITELLSRIEL